MNLATESNLKEVMRLFQQHKEFFPHIRQDYVKRKILANNLILEDNVVIAFSLYKKDVKLGNLSVPKGQIMLHQIAAGIQGDGSASRVLNKFLQYAFAIFFVLGFDDNLHKGKLYLLFSKQ